MVMNGFNHNDCIHRVWKTLMVLTRVITKVTDFQDKFSYRETGVEFLIMIICGSYNDISC